MNRDINPGKPPNPPKHLSLDDEDVKSTLTALKLASKIKQSLDKKFNQVTDLFQEIRDSIQMVLKELKNILISHCSKISQVKTT